MQSKLPPLPEEAFDGEKYETRIEHVRCDHKELILGSNTLSCKKCKVGWEGHDVYRLYELLTQKT